MGHDVTRRKAKGIKLKKSKKVINTMNSTHVTEATSKYDEATQEAQENGIVRIATDRVLVRHDGHDGCGTNSDVLAATQEHVHKTPHECRIKTILWM